MATQRPRSISSDSYSSCSEEDIVSNSDHSDGSHNKHGTNDDHGHIYNDQRRGNNNHGGSNDEKTHEKYYGGSRDGHGRNHDHEGSNNNHEGSHGEEGGSGGSRSGRSSHRPYRRSRNSYNIYSRRKGSKPHNHPVSEVVMPSGTKSEISQLVLKKYECGAKTKLQRLHSRKREYIIVKKEMQESIMNHYDCKNGGGCFKQYNIVKVEKVLQGCVWRKYQNRKTDVTLENNKNANEKMLFHGSTEIGAIIKNGFDERHANANGKLGSGIYFTPKSSAANQFVFGFYGGDGCKIHKKKNCYICERKILLCRVTLGKCKRFTDTSVGQIVHPEPGYHSAVGIPGDGAFEYEEYVIYRGEQAYPEYLITYKIEEEKERHHKY